jgi:hypothetical protein
VGGGGREVIVEGQEIDEREVIHSSTVVPPYPRVILSKTDRGYVKLRIIPNAIHDVISV